jgi:hydrogenase maturation protease
MTAFTPARAGPGRGSLVLALGNPVMTDDAVGLHVADALRALLRARPLRDVQVLKSQRAGFELVEMLPGYDRAIIVDAVLADDPLPGRVRELTLDDLSGSRRLINAHEISLPTALEMGRRLGLDMPEEVELIAIEAIELYTMSTTMTAPVQAAVEPVAQRIYDRLATLHQPMTPAEATEAESERRFAWYAPDEEG